MREPIKLDEARRRIHAEIRQGRFTPFLGAGASSLRPRELDLAVPPWSNIKRAIEAMRLTLTQEPTRGAAYLYLRSFAEHRLRISGEGLRTLLPVDSRGRPVWKGRGAAPRTRSGSAREAAVAGPSADGTGGWPDEGLLRFQCSLLSLAAELGGLFGQAFASYYPPVDELSTCKVVIHPAPSLKSPYVRLLFEVVNRAVELPADSAPELGRWLARGQRPRLNVEEIRRKLLWLSYELVTRGVRESQPFQIWRQQHRAVRLPEWLEQRDADEVAIELTMLQWLSDLLWYTLRYWLPSYPTTAELAFELSLADYDGVPRRAELAQAAEALSDQAVDRLTPRLRYCEQAQECPARLHLAIAAVLQHEYAGYRAKLEALRIPQPSAGLLDDDGSAVQLGYMPVAFTTNFDRALEMAFEKLARPYHVVYPVRVVRGPEKGRLEWLLRTKFPPGRADYDEVVPCGDGPPGNLVGPVVVKLHGSPLDRDRGRQHWLVLSETGYLEALDSTLSPLPKWVEQQLEGSSDGGGRSLWFLGYSVSDWNIRLRLYEHLRHSRKASPPLEKSVVERRRQLGSFRVAIFGSLDIQVCVGDLTMLPDIIQDALEQVERSDEVKQFLDEMRG